MDNDSKMLSELSDALINLQVKYKSSSLPDRMKILPELEKLIGKTNAYQLKLLNEGTITTDEDLQEMEALKKEIDKAANAEQLIKAIVKTIGFIAFK